MSTSRIFPRQKLSYRQKGKKWRKDCVDWADKKSYVWDSSVRKSFKNKRINYDLYNGKIHMSDMTYYINPRNTQSRFIPENIQHYPIMNDHLGVLIGEESNRRFDFVVRVSNFDAISNKEKEMIGIARQRLIDTIEDESQSDEEVQAKLQQLSHELKYEYQDLREIRANYMMNHYMKELDMKLKWNTGFKDALISGEEIYQFDIVHGEPTFEVLNPRRVHVVRSGRSARIEDADIVITEDYWSPAKILDVYHDKLKNSEVERIEEYNTVESSDEMKNIDERNEYIRADEALFDGSMIPLEPDNIAGSNYTDEDGNIRVLRIYWKSKREIKRVKRYHPETGEEIYELYTEDYKPRKELGEEVKKYWINEAWEGTKLGSDVYVNIKPRAVQYNRLSNPSKCHFGIIGQVYNTNQSRAVSLVDRMKPTVYLYDVMKHQLLKTLAKNHGKILELDQAKIPDNWDIDKWLHFAKEDGIAVIDSFKEGNKGTATGKLAGTFNTTGKTLDLELGNSIQIYISVIEYLKNSLGDLSGITPQRKGNVSTRETVGGVERAVNQSAHITQELFTIHDNVKKRCIECLVETSKIALRGKSKKLQYISDDYANTIFTMPGDEFAECDYGIVVDNDASNTEIDTKVEQLAHAAMQNQQVQFSTVVKLMKGTSLSKAMRIIETDEEQAKQERAEQAQMQREQMEQAAQAEQAKVQAEMADKQAERDLKDKLNLRDNQTKIITSQGGEEGVDDLELRKLELQEQSLADKKTSDDEKLNLDKSKLQETERSNKAKEAIARTKKVSTNN